jgi:hypothetical protein
MTEQKSTTMRGLFPGYYRPTDEEFKELWEKCIFIFDANVLLNLYLYDRKTLDEFLKVLKVVNERLWIPHQVALEFQKNRITNIKKRNKEVEDLKNELNGVKNKIIVEFKKHPSIYSQVGIDDTNNQFELLLKSLHLLEEQLPKVKNYDTIREQIDKLFENKIGEFLTQDELDSIYEEGEERYAKKYPPGFMDKKEKEKEPPYEWNGLMFKGLYGDLIIWKEILKQAKQKNWKHIIWVTDDTKEDWWFKDKDDSDNIISPRRELIEETLKFDITRFYMYSSQQFLKFAKQNIPGITIEEESIKQVGDFIELAREKETIEKTTDKFARLSPKEVEALVLDWLLNLHINDGIVHSEHSSSMGIDFICSSASSSLDKQFIVGYEVKYLRGFRLSQIGMRNHLRQLGAYVQGQHLDKAYLLLVIESRSSKAVTLACMNYQNEVKNLDLTHKIGLIVGTILYVDDNPLSGSYFSELARIEPYSS